MIHQLVAKHFIPNPLNKSQVNHIDKNKRNNSVDNLEWSTNKENMHHSYSDIYPKASQKAKELCSKPVAQYTKTGEQVVEYSSLQEASDATNNAKSNISASIYRNGSCGGFVWKFIERGSAVD